MTITIRSHDHQARSCDHVTRSHDKGWSLQYALYLDLRPGSRLGQGVNGLFSLWSTGQGPIYKVKIWVKVKGLQPVDIQNVELVQCRVTSLPIYKAATTAIVPRKGCETMRSRWKTK